MQCTLNDLVRSDHTMYVIVHKSEQQYLEINGLDNT